MIAKARVHPKPAEQLRKRGHHTPGQERQQARDAMKKFSPMLGILLSGICVLAACAGPATPTLTPVHPTEAPTAIPASPTPPPTAAQAAAPVAPVVGLPAGTNGFSWWNDSVFYEIFVRSFYDSNGDGIGDFNGITAKLDYLNDGNPATTADLGVTGLWLMPIQPAASYHGYDVTDYYNVNPDYGTLDDFKRLLAEAHKRGIRVILDLVLNHTSNLHPWFKASQDPQSTYRDWYVWSTTDPGWSGPGGEQVWHADSQAGYYYGFFGSNMPDLNYNNPLVTEKMYDVARFWLKEVGVDGFRLDAVQYLVEQGKVLANSDLNHAWFKSFQTYLKSIQPQAMTVGEVWTNSALVSEYLQGQQLDLAFDFDLAQALIVSARVGRAEDAAQVLAADYAMGKPDQFATFLANHDQNRALSQLAGKAQKGGLAATMLLTAPGVPFVYYGEEIGMLGLKPDEQIRTPMVWSEEKNGGFTTGTPWETAVTAPPPTANVADETNDPNSLLSDYRTLIRARAEHVALRVGDLAVVTADNPAVYSILRSTAQETVLVVINLSADPVTGYHLKLATGPLAGSYQAAPILGVGPYADLTANAQGGFDSYQPVPTLEAGSRLILQLQHR